MDWRIKVAVQFVLAHVPGGERVNYALQRLSGRHSAISQRGHIKDTVSAIAFVQGQRQIAGLTIVEVGTGWQPFGGLLFSLLGAERVHTFDHVRHVRIEVVQSAIASLLSVAPEIAERLGQDEGTIVARLRALQGCGTLEEVFDRARISYHAPGDATQTGIPGESVDLFYSYAVLEHVPESVIAGLLLEARRVLKEGGIAYHAIGLGDHYATSDRKVTSVNFLQYPEWLWSFLIKNKISYHNRLREPQFLELFRSHGCDVVALRHKLDPMDAEAARNMRVTEAFRRFSPDELAVRFTEVVLSF